MFKNYLKITWAVMKRRKFYTFISLFGISLTLTILIVLTSFIDVLLHPTYPEINRERSLYVERLILKDSKQGYYNSSPVSQYFIKTYIQPLSLTEKISTVSEPRYMNTFVNGQKAAISTKFTDEKFWEITAFNFLEGRPFTAQTLKSNDNAIIITDEMRDKFFGKGIPVVGKKLTIADDEFHVVGVIEACPLIEYYAASNFYLPNTADKSPQKNTLHGGYMAIILANNKDDLPKIKAEFKSIISKIPLEKQTDFTPDEISAPIEGFGESFTERLTNAKEGDGNSRFYTILVCFALLFMLLPTLNLVNINISRIMERASEIGIRKAFGASAMTLTGQFIVENVILTVIGGAVAIVLSAVIIGFINRNGIGIITFLNLSINWTVVVVAFVLSLVFGLLSGVYPAWRMSRLAIVEALKN